MKKIKVIGRKPLEGEVTVSGSKNAALPILAATLLLDGQTTIRNVPNLLDVITIVRVLRALGLRAEYIEPDTVKVWGSQASIKHVAPYELVTKMRASFFVIGPILARKGLAKVPLPGGCAIGSRPVDLHIKGMRCLGAKVHMEHGFVVVQADRLVGTNIHLDFPSVGATESIIMAASLASGTTVLENAAREPEIMDLANFLNKAGAKIIGAGTDTIQIVGVNKLSAVEYRVIPDRIEAGTLMLGSAITGGDVLVHGVVPSHIESFVSKLKEAGADVALIENSVRVNGRKRLQGINIKTLPFPGFPTDMQPQFTALLSVSRGTSVVAETVFENRFMHMPELQRMGAIINLEGRSVVIEGINQLSGAPVKASDLRAGAALVLAGLAAEGETIIEDNERFIERGYYNLVGKFSCLGADMRGE